MDSDLTKGRSRRAFSSFLRALTTYASPLTLVLGPALAFLGIGIGPSLLRWIVYGCLIPVAGIAWLLNEYRIAVHKIEVEGKVQSPEWLWTFLTNRITHSRKQIPAGAQVMVLVPPGRSSEAAKLSEIYNHESTEHLCDGQHNLLFHNIPQSSECKPDKGAENAESEGEAQRLENLSSDLANCEALLLLDDGEWKQRYATTLKVIQDWTVDHTERAVVSVHLNGIGRLIYNWCPFESVTGDNNQALHSRLLAQATTRGGQWYEQARLYRWLVIRLALITLVVSLAWILTGYFLWTWGTKHKEQAQASEARFNSLVSVGGNGSEQVNVAKSLASFRNASKPADWNTLQNLLNESAFQLKDVVVRNSGVSDVSVSIFSVSVNKTSLEVYEVGASRPGFTISPYDFNTDLTTEPQKSILDCAIVQGAFILWSGDTKAKLTTNIKAWDLQGSTVAWPYNEKNQTLETGRHVCWYQFPGDLTKQPAAGKAGEKDVPQKRLLCAPAGSTYNIHEPGNGAICISVPSDVEFLSEPWVRFTLLRFGNALSFSSWARPKTTSPPKSPSKSSP